MRLTRSRQRSSGHSAVARPHPLTMEAIADDVITNVEGTSDSGELRSGEFWWLNGPVDATGSCAE